MRILLTDETNREPGPTVKFFVYGGLILNADDLSPLDAGIAEIRRDLGYSPQDDLKFDTRCRPPCVSISTATEAKRRVIALCKELQAKFIAYVALHDIIKHADPDDQVLFATNTVIRQFNKYLRDVVHDDGICVVDVLPVKHSWKYLSEKFTLGLAYEERYVPVERIKMFCASCNNASHASSAMDIVLGTFRYCINDPANPQAASEMMANVVDLMWHERDGDTILAYERGLVMRPLVHKIKVDAYRNEYEHLIDHINELLEDDESPD